LVGFDEFCISKFFLVFNPGDLYYLVGLKYNNNTNNNNNNHGNFYGAIIMAKVIARVHPVHLMNAD